MKPVLRFVGLVPGVALAVVLAAAPATQKFSGTITDSMCSDAVHTRMRMGPTDAECAVACASIHDADYLLHDGKASYVLSPHKSVEQFAGQKVTVTGTLDTKTRTIQVEAIEAAQ